MIPRSRIEEIARSLGFAAVGAAAAVPGDEGSRLERFVAEGRHGTMGSLARDPARRSDPGAVVPGARSVVMAAAACPIPDDPGPAPLHGRVARYACHDDYHDVLLGPLRELAAALGDPDARAYVDTGPVMEKVWARRAGLGWIGRNTLLITRARGVWQLLGAIVTRAEVEPSPPHPDHCGTCTRCVDACPTGALTLAHEGPTGEGGRPTGAVLDARRCRAYLSIERRGPLTEQEEHDLGDALFGCDLCLEACPFNRFADGPAFPGLVQRLPVRVDLPPLLGLEGAAFRSRFAGTPVVRARRRGLLRNTSVILGNLGDPDAIPHLERCAAQEEDEVVRESAARALRRLGAGV